MLASFPSLRTVRFVARRLGVQSCIPNCVTSRSSQRRWRTAGYSLWLAALVMGFGAQAAKLSVTVQKADGNPVGDVVVQIAPVGSWVPPEPGAPVVLNQKDMRFEPYVVALPLGGTLRLTNMDRYDHHVRSMAGGPLGQTPPAKSFEVRLPAWRNGQASTADVRMDGSAGSITLGCHIHGSMRGHVFVSATPWVMVSEDRGALEFDNLPEGLVELRLWHPDQLLEQPVQKLQLGPQQSATVKLNFNPRKRRVAPPSDSYYQ